MWRRINQPAPQSPPIRLTAADGGINNADASEIRFGNITHLKYPIATQNELKLVEPKTGARLGVNAKAAFDAMVKAAAGYTADKRAPNGIYLFARYGFRDFETQEDIWNHAKGADPQTKAKSAAPPHYSEHHTPFAVDINWAVKADWTDRENRRPMTEGSAAHDWLIANAHLYGFVNSFPRGNKQGVKAEAWHWRFQGDCESRKVFEGARERFGPPETEAEREKWSHCDAE